MSYLIERRQLHRLELMLKTMFKNHDRNRVENDDRNRAENHDRNRVENHDRNRVQNRVQKRIRKHVRKIKNIVNKNMSFLKNTDPMKGDFIVNEFLKTRQNIQENFLSERLGDVNTQYELSKLFKPVTDMQKDFKEGLVSELKPIREGMKNLSKTITFPQFQSITAYDDDDVEEKEAVFIRDIAEQYLRKFATMSGADKTFGYAG